jgi:sulfur-oxidizing protein SoxB
MTMPRRRAKQFPIRILSALAALVLALCAMPGTAGTPRLTPDVRILWTNDTHGYLSSIYHREEGDDRFLEQARREGRVGGFAHIATLIKRQRALFPGRTLVLDAGDTWHGTVVPLRLDGRPVLEVMNAIGYDAMVPGNVEFFYDRATLERLFAAARFPIVVANLYDAQWDEPVALPNVQPYVIKQVGPLKVAIVGMTYHWMSKVADHPQWAFGLRINEVQADINRLRTEHKVDLVVLLSHMGWEVDARYAELVSGIDVIVGAHTHDILYRPTLVYNKTSGRDVLVAQCGSHGKLLGQLDLKIRSRRVVAFEQTLFPVRAKDIAPDRDIAALIEKYRAPYKAELERVIGETRTLLYRQGTWQSSADNLVTDALRARTRQEIAVAEPGRYGATILPGPITVEDVYNLVPMESPVHHMKFSGHSLREMLEAAVDNVVTGDPLERVGSNMWRFSGLELVVDPKRPYPERVRSLRVNGEPVDKQRLYTLAEFNMFLRNNPLAVDVQATDRIGPHEIIAYIEDAQTVAATPDRRLTDTAGAILSDHDHLHEHARDSGRSEVDPAKNGPIRFRGGLDARNRLRLHKP